MNQNISRRISVRQQIAVQRNVNKTLQQKLNQLRREDDILLVFLEKIFSKGPVAYFLINIIIMIWLGQSVLTSNLTQVPKSIYLMSQLINTLPIQDIYAAQDGRCPTNFQLNRLFTLPGIKNESQPHYNITKWKQSLVFCIQKIAPIGKKYDNCPQNITKCNNYCIKPNTKCPITDIRRISNQDLQSYTNYETFYKDTKQNFTYIFTRSEGNPIVKLISFIQKDCSNQFYYHQDFKTMNQFIADLKKECGKQGQLTAILKQIDMISTKKLLVNNNYSSKLINLIPIDFDSYLKSVYEIKLKDESPYCRGIIQNFQNLKKKILNSSILTPFKQIVSISTLIFLLISIVWLLIYSCWNLAYMFQTGLIIGLIQLIQFVILKVKYEDYFVMTTLTQVHKCIQQGLQGPLHWQFGMKSVSEFNSIIFCNTAFLLLSILSWVLLRTIYRQ